VPASFGKRPPNQMVSFQRGSIVGSILGIVVCGGIGGMVAWAIVRQLGWGGTFGAMIAAIIGMVVATAAWTALTSLLRMLRRTR
jgi:uncharacterized membrane protein YeaQ/YmgE (transglycosylase-associated protein family)